MDSAFIHQAANELVQNAGTRNINGKPAQTLTIRQSPITIIIPSIIAIKIDTKKNDGENWLVCEFDVMGKDFVLELECNHSVYRL